MPTEGRPVSVHILDKDYRIACKEGTEDELIAAARLLDRRMREIRESGKTIGGDRIAVMAALNIAHELLKLKEASESQGEAITQRLRRLSERVDAVVQGSRPAPLENPSQSG